MECEVCLELPFSKQTKCKCSYPVSRDVMPFSGNFFLNLCSFVSKLREEIKVENNQVGGFHGTMICWMCRLFQLKNSPHRMKNELEPSAHKRQFHIFSYMGQ